MLSVNVHYKNFLKGVKNQKMVESGLHEKKAKAPTFGIRHLQCLLLFWGITLAYAMRVSMSLAIVAMTDKKSTNQDFAEYAWSEKIKALLLSSFFWGYITTQIPGGYLAHKFGGKIAILFGVVTASALAILTPLAAEFGGWPLVFISCMLQGMTQGALFPTTHALLAKWAPVEERAVLATYCYSGSQFGTVVMLVACGFLASSPLGWPSIFYLAGALGLLWSLAWYYWGASSPQDYKNISAAEREFIESSLQRETQQEQQSTKHQRKTPWTKFLSSPAFLSLIIAHCSYSWCFWTILTQIPSYMKNVMGLNIKSNALLTGLPYFGMLVFTFIFAAMAAFFEKRKWLNITQSRLTFNTISSWIPALALVGLGYVDANQTKLAVGLLVINVSFTAAMHMGFQINHIDLSPNFAGVLFGITNTSANFMSIFAPLLVGFIVTDVKNVLQWRIVFFIAAGFGFIGNLVFIIFGSGRVQSWNNPEQVAENDEMEPMRVQEKESNDATCEN